MSQEITKTFSRSDAKRHSMIFALARAAGWHIEWITEANSGKIEVKLARSDGKAYGTWTGSAVEFRLLCNLTTPPSAG